jgi:serine protease Do
LQLAPANEVTGFGDSQGVVVTGVDPDGPAAEQGIQPGNVILDVGGKAVTSPGDVRKALINAKDQGKHDVLMRLKTGEATKFVAVTIGQKAAG